jgi:hypothetical protein
LHSAGFAFTVPRMIDRSTPMSIVVDGADLAAGMTSRARRPELRIRAG